ncbi:MAG: hypothetical protein EBU93_00640 [Chlamydiae bacterium]|jgi:hypothetical protein|nr:hypothetical protein [Chlamydiota bacterium]
MKTFPLLNKIILIVLFFHIGFVIFSFIPDKKTTNIKQTPIVIKTVQKPSSIQSKPTSKKPIIKEKPHPKLIKQEKKPIKKEEKPKELPGKPMKPSAPSSKKASSNFDQVVIPELKSASTPLPSSEKLAFDPEEILIYLESIVELPKKGSVKVKLLILPSAKIQEVEILEADLEDNKRYLVERLKGFQLPLETKILENKELIVTFRGL